MGDGLTIQEAAEHAGLTAHTLRYYERVGLLDPVRRAGNGHRRFGDADLLDRKIAMYAKRESTP
jgi:DNA-binding transcriptional MerR regulator